MPEVIIIQDVLVPLTTQDETTPLYTVPDPFNGFPFHVSVRSATQDISDAEIAFGFSPAGDGWGGGQLQALTAPKRAAVFNVGDSTEIGYGAEMFSARCVKPSAHPNAAAYVTIFFYQYE